MRWMIFGAAALLVVAMGVTDAAEPSSRPTSTFYCSPQGADSPQAGAKQNPWKTIDYALGRIGKGGGAILVLADGTYQRPRNDWKFEAPVVIRAQNALRAEMETLKLHGAKNLTFEGITFDRQNAPTPNNVVHMDGETSYCTLRNCLMTHGAGGYQNTDALKIGGSHHILVEDCRIFDGTDEEVDILGGVHDIVFRRNVVYQVKVKKPEALVSNKFSAYRVMFEGNIFANLNPESSNGALRFGGGERKGQEAHTLIAISNLFVNTTGRGAITFVGATKCLVADNIFVNHDDHRTGAVAIYTNYPGGGVTNDELFLVHNVFYDARGRWKNPIYAFEAARPTTWLFSHNLYWNGGKAIPKDHWHDPSRERGALFKDPLFSGDLGKLVGRPSRAWFDILRLRKDSPFRTNAVQLEALSLPHELRQFLADYRHGHRDPWYRRIQQR